MCKIEVVEKFEWLMREALKEAKKAFRKTEVPIGAVIFDEKKQKIISRAFNRREHSRDATAHAEVIAIKKACRRIKDFRLEDCVLVATMAPCAMCAGACINARINTIVYGADSDRMGDNMLKHVLQNNDANHKCKIVGGVLAHECGELVKNFFVARRQKPDLKNLGKKLKQKNEAK